MCTLFYIYIYSIFIIIFYKKECYFFQNSLLIIVNNKFKFFNNVNIIHFTTIMYQDLKKELIEFYISRKL